MVLARYVRSDGTIGVRGPPPQCRAADLVETRKGHQMNNLNGNYDPDAARRSRRRKQAAVGAVGLAAIVGGGAFLVTEIVTRDAPSRTPDPMALAPTAAATSAATATPFKATPASPPPAVSVSRTPSPSAPTRTRTAAERVAAARSAAAKDGVKVQRPLPGVTAAGALEDLSVTDSGSLREDRGTMRVVSARGDLTGYRELSWVADDGDAVGPARCSQTFRFANNAKPARKPNLLVCWRTSVAKSVYTVTVDLDGRPSKQDSVAALAKRWSAMG
jgi:hypothetical protein